MRYRVTSDAEADLIDIEDYILTYADPDFLDVVEEQFLEAFHEICRHPFAQPVFQFRPPIETLHEYRSVNVYHYKIFYWVDGDVVEIYRIRHLVSDFTRESF